MNTLFHGAVNTTVAVQLRKRLPWLRPSTVLWASLIPDIPLLFLTLWYFRRYGFGFGARYDELFYNDPLWIISHNLFHAPLIISIVGILGWVVWRRGLDDAGNGYGDVREDSSPEAASGGPAGLTGRIGSLLLSFAFGTGLHTLVDIPTHHNDGPLLLFPFDWTLRYASPVSYWDPAAGGRILAPIDLGLTVLCIVFLALAWRRSRGAYTRR